MISDGIQIVISAAGKVRRQPVRERTAGTSPAVTIIEDACGLVLGDGTMHPIVSVEQLARLGDDLHARGLRIVFTNGHFDLLHVGHLRYLQAARRLGDALVVGVNDDAVTRTRKGPGRPILTEAERAELLAGLACVDFVAIFHEPTAERCVQLLRPDVYVKGGDYGPGGTELPEARVVETYGGESVILPLTPGRSTSAIVEAIRRGESAM
jgi:rfaE bifunctional protein nucleotidyltransferase chain/domain